MFVKKDKIRFYCKCQNSPRDILIIDIKEYLINCNDDEISGHLKCPNHSDIYYKYIFYCSVCKKQKCEQCCRDCRKHIDKVNPISADIRTINKLGYIYEKFIENKKNYINDSNNFTCDDIIINKNNTILLNDNNNIENQNGDYLNDINNNIDNSEEKLFLSDNDENNNNNNINNINNDNIDFLPLLDSKSESNLELSINDLINIIIYDYKYFPNYEHIDIISNIEKFVIYNYDKCNEIKLKYEINKNMVDDKLTFIWRIFC